MTVCTSVAETSFKDQVVVKYNMFYQDIILKAVDSYIIHNLRQSPNASYWIYKYRYFQTDKFKTTWLAVTFLLCWLLDEDGLSLHINQCMKINHEWFPLCELWRHSIQNSIWEKNERKNRWACYTGWAYPLPQPLTFCLHNRITLQNLIQ